LYLTKGVRKTEAAGYSSTALFPKITGSPIINEKGVIVDPKTNQTHKGLLRIPSET